MVIAYMQGIYNYMPETNHASRVHNFVAILYLQFMVHVMLFPMLNVSFFYISTLLLLLLLLLSSSSLSSSSSSSLSSLVTGLFFLVLEPAVIPTAQASSFTLQYFP